MLPFIEDMHKPTTLKWTVAGDDFFGTFDYAPMIYTAPCVMFWMRVDPLRGQVGGGRGALEIETLLVGPVKWHRAVMRVSFGEVRSC